MRTKSAHGNIYVCVIFNIPLIIFLESLFETFYFRIIHAGYTLAEYGIGATAAYSADDDIKLRETCFFFFPKFFSTLVFHNVSARTTRIERVSDLSGRYLIPTYPYGTFLSLGEGGTPLPSLSAAPF